MKSTPWITYSHELRCSCQINPHIPRQSVTLASEELFRPLLELRLTSMGMAKVYWEEETFVRSESWVGFVGGECEDTEALSSTPCCCISCVQRCYGDRVDAQRDTMEYGEMGRDDYGKIR